MRRILFNPSMKTIQRQFSSKSGKNVFAAATELAVRYNSINLGQGFPSFPMDDYVKEAAIEAIKDNKNQYVRPGGSIELVKVLAEKYTGHLGYEVDPFENICVFGGAQQGIFVCLSVLCERGDKVVCIEPAFDSYRKSAEYLKLDYKPVTLLSDNSLDIDSLKQAAATAKLLILNNPHNPTGKVFTEEELFSILELLNEFPELHILSDEVYEFLVFDDLEHHFLLGLASPEQRQRVVSLSSAGKSFSCTGWRLGYSIASKSIAERLLHTQGVMTFCGTSPIEAAIAKSFVEQEKNGAFSNLCKKLEFGRDKLEAVLKSIPSVTVQHPQGGYFIIADFSELANEKVKKVPDEPLDFVFNEWLSKEVGVTGIPMSSFYSNPRSDSECFIRLAFCKTEEELEEAASRFRKLV